MRRELAKLPLLFILLTLTELLLLAAVACIPRRALQKNLKKSADFYMQKEVFYFVDEKDPASEIDHYADAILLNILSFYRSDIPFSSVLSSSYYYTDNHNENENLLTAVTENPAPTYDYFRYWHGSTVLIRPLLLLFSIDSIYRILSAFLLLLTALLLYALYKKKEYAAAVCFVLSMIGVSFWYVPMSLEYIWSFLIMLCASLFVVTRTQSCSRHFLLFFFAVGNLTAFVDFLTTETVTVLLPLSLLLLLDVQKRKDFRSGFRTVLSSGILWGAGYASAFVSKWTLSFLVLHRNVFAEALSSAEVRVNGSAETVKGFSMTLGALIRNVSCLFPFNFLKSNACFAALGLLVLLLMFYYLFRNTQREKGLLKLFAILFFVPYIRFAVLANHSFIHYFFTYRAQFSSVFLLLLILCKGIDPKLLTSCLPRKRHRHS